MLKITVLPKISTFKELKIDNNKAIEINNKKFIKKSRKLKGQKTLKSQKLAKLVKKQSKSENLLKNNAIKKFSFLILGTKINFNHLRLTFIKTLILKYFNLKYYIWIKTNA